jgi:Spy/CpxP family protein refolding chaperone
MAGLVLILVILGGGVAGVVVDRLVLLPFHFHDRPFGPWRAGPPPGGMERRARERFAREIGLSDSQQVKIDSLMDTQMRELRAVRGEMQPRLDSILAQTRRSIDAILTPEQRTKAEALMRRGRGRGGPEGPPGDARGPGRPLGAPDGGPPPPPDAPPPR